MPQDNNDQTIAVEKMYQCLSLKSRSSAFWLIEVMFQSHSGDVNTDKNGIFASSTESETVKMFYSGCDK